MDCSPCTYYHSDVFNTKLYLDSYFTAAVDDEVLQGFTIDLIKNLHMVFSSGHIGGDTLIDISAGHVLFQLFPVCEFFKEIIILDCNDSSILEVKKWIRNDPDAHDWSYVPKIVMKLENSSKICNEDMVKKKVKSIMKCDLANKNPTFPIQLPKANCILSAWMLEVVSEDYHAYRCNLKNLSSLLEVGGHLVLIADMGASFFIVGDKKYHVLKYDECFLRQVLTNEGYSIKCFKEIKKAPTSLYDISKIAFVVAQKQ